MSKLHKFDVVDYLKTDEDIAAYIAAVLEDNDPVLFLAAMKDIARAEDVNSVLRNIE